ncbi:MAG: efflux RND transporter periplasmic adaptor subunit [Candidatus Aminicenantes bacterium]
MMMKKIVFFITAAVFVFTVSCGKSGDDSAEAVSPPGKPEASQAGEVDVDKLDIPDKMKEAIKSGEIPEERVKKMLARFQQQSGEEPGFPVSVTQVDRRDLQSYQVVSGIVEPQRRVEVHSRLPAYVKQILKEEGDYVRENEALALLDDTEIRINYEQAGIAVEQAKVNLEEARQNYERSVSLKERELISEQEFQTAETTYKQRELDYQDRVKNFNNLELQLNWTRVRSPSEGYVTERLIEVGDRVSANAHVYTIEDFDPLLIRVYVPASDAAQLREGLPAEVTTEVRAGLVFNGSVKLINPRLDPNTGTVKVTVEVFDESRRLIPGMFVEVQIAVGQKENVLVIPRKAVVYRQNMPYVFVVNRGQVTQREVVLGLTEEDEVEVVEGLREGDVIVEVGVEALKDGQRVEII